MGSPKQQLLRTYQQAHVREGRRSYVEASHPKLVASTKVFVAGGELWSPRLRHRLQVRAPTIRVGCTVGTNGARTYSQPLSTAFPPTTRHTQTTIPANYTNILLID
ncbi:unnamed protein product [Ectocarpus sp. 12 AP-2014]